MSKAMELKKTTDIVKDLLISDADARNSDDYLYYLVCQRINAIYLNLPFGKVMLNRKNYGYPAFESVRRTRQKLQVTYPELAGSSDVEAAREVNEETFKNYSVGCV